MATFGDSAVHGEVSGYGAGEVQARYFPNFPGGLVESMSVLLKYGDGNAKIRLAMYSDDNGLPGSLLWASDELTTTPDMSTLAFRTISGTPVQVEAQDVWLAYGVYDYGVWVGYKSISALDGQYSYRYGGSFPEVWSYDPYQFKLENAIYVTYSVGGAGPTLTSISPERGYTTGGTSVTLTGEGFTGATGVTFGGTAATNVTVVNDTTITCTTPEKTAGPSKVVVKHGDGDSTDNVFFEFFVRLAAPTLTAEQVGSLIVVRWAGEQPDPFDPDDGTWLWVTAAPYSAAGDGTTNDRTALQNCVNAAAAAGKGVYIPPGTYLIGKPPSGNQYISLPSNVTMRGIGDASVIKFDDDSSSSMDGFSGYSKSGVSFVDLKMLGTLTDNDTKLSIVRGEPLSDLSFIRCTFDNCQDAVKLIGDNPAKLSDGVLLKDCASLTGCLQLLVGGYMTNIEIDGGNYEVNRDNYRPGEWPHHLYLRNYVTNVYVHDATFTGGVHATMDLEDDYTETTGNFLFENIEMSGVRQGWFVAGVYNVVIDGLTWVHDSRMDDYTFWLVGDTVDFQLKNSTITGYSSKSVSLCEVHSTCKSNTNKIGPNVTMTNCASGAVANHGCDVEAGGTKPTIVAPVSVS